MRFAIACLAAFAAISSSMGEELRWRQLSPRAAEADRGAAVIREAKVSAEIHGWLARTDYEMVVGAKTEGSGETQVQVAAEFSLREGDVICGFGIDIGGEIRPASGADSARARIAYESVVRRMIDPGLVEQIGENRYRIRVFPVTATAPRTIHLRIDSLLTEIGDRLEYRPPLDLAAEEAIDFQIAAHGAEPRWEGREFQPEGGRPHSWQLRRALRDLGEVAVSVAAPGGDVALVGDDGGAHYFAVRPAIEPGEAMPPGRRVALFWDTSGSLADIDAARILEKVAVWMLRRSAREVVLIPFSVGMGAPQRFELRDGGWTALEKAVGELLYDGGTHFGALDFAAERCDTALVVTDGRGTWAGPNPAAAPGADAAALPPVHVFDLDGGVIDPALEEAVAATGGRLFGLDHQYVARSSVALGTADYALDQGQGAHAPAFYGAMHSEAARLRFAYQGGDEREIRVLARDAKFSPAGPLLRVRFAKAAADQIAAGGAANDRRLSAHGRDAGIVTARSSLIVLERLSDYLRHKIDPPPALAKEFHAAQREAAAANDRAANDAPSNPELARDYWTGLDAEWWRASPEALNLDPFLAYSPRRSGGIQAREAAGCLWLAAILCRVAALLLNGARRGRSSRMSAPRRRRKQRRPRKDRGGDLAYESGRPRRAAPKTSRRRRGCLAGKPLGGPAPDRRRRALSADSFGSSDPFGSIEDSSDPFAAATGPAPAGPPPSRFGPESAPASAGPSAADSIAEAGSAGTGSDLRPLRLAAPGDHALFTGRCAASSRRARIRRGVSTPRSILWQNGEPALALRALSNLSELELGNPSLARAQAFALGAWGKHGLAALPDPARSRLSR
ncbi:MAG: VIT domain-containing protein [Verrucomicrobiales bacterium]